MTDTAAQPAGHPPTPARPAASERHVTLVWIGLMVFTCTTTWGMTSDAVSPAVAVVGIFAIAAAKVALVMAEFMELRRAPWQVAAVFGTWVVGVTALILVFWFITPEIA